jgi:hypothetical protein
MLKVGITNNKIWKVRILNIYLPFGDPDFKEDTFDIDHVRIYDQAGTLIFSDKFN